MLTIVTLLTLISPGVAALDAAKDRDVIESLETDGMGRSGTLKTRPLHLDGTPGTYTFGSGPCAKYRIADHVLAALHAALRSKQPVLVKSVNVKETHCLTAVTFFPPEP